MEELEYIAPPFSDDEKVCTITGFSKYFQSLYKTAKLHNEELHKLYSSPSIITVI
jgi:hypothetical protein